MKRTQFLFSFSIIYLFITTETANADRTKDRMYEQINGASACFRRTNATHQTGCTSDSSGSTGIIHVVNTRQDLSSILLNGTGSLYVPLIPLRLMTGETVDLLKSSRKINGVLVYKENDTTIESYSHEGKCPNRNFALKNTCDVEWNKVGTDFLNEDIRFPMFYVTDAEDVQRIKDCYYKFNNVSILSHDVRSLCSVELLSFMFSAIDTPTCIRRMNPLFNLNTVKLCDPLGAKNAWSTLFPVGNSTVQFGADKITQTVKRMKYILVVSRLDSTSMFEDQVPGAHNPITGIVTLLYTAKLLKTMIPTYDDYDTNVMFLLLSGESYDYMGSQRLLFDMQQGVFPSKEFKSENESIPSIKIDDVRLIVELNQLKTTDTLHLHYYEEKPEMRNFVTKLNKYRGGFKLDESSGRIPPSSLQTFLLKKSNLSGLVITDHKAEYLNKYYNSILDDGDALGYEYYNNTDDIPDDSIQRHVVNVGRVLAKGLYEEVTNKSAVNPTDDPELVNELFECYYKNASCRIHQLVGKKKLAMDRFSLYVRVVVSRNIFVAYAGLTLSWLTGDAVGDGPCPSHVNSYVNKYFNMSKSLADLNTTVCYRTCMNFTDAVSPAFIIEGYDWSSNKYSSWTESSWKELNVRLFLKPSPSHEIVTIVVGSTVALLSFVVVYFVSSRSRILFPTPDLTSPTRC